MNASLRPFAEIRKEKVLRALVCDMQMALYLLDALDDVTDHAMASGAVYRDEEGERLNPELKTVRTFIR
jgi:hypothetical protein